MNYIARGILSGVQASSSMRRNVPSFTSTRVEGKEEDKRYVYPLGSNLLLYIVQWVAATLISTAVCYLLRVICVSRVPSRALVVASNS